MLIKVQAGELLGATLSLFYVSHRKNSRPQGGAFIRSLQTGFLGKKVEEQIEADYNRVEEGKPRKCNRSLLDAPGRTPGLERKTEMLVEKLRELNL